MDMETSNSEDLSPTPPSQTSPAPSCCPPSCCAPSQKVSSDRWGMFSIGFLGGFLVGLLLLATAMVSSRHNHHPHHRWHRSHHEQTHDHMRDSMRDRMRDGMTKDAHGDLRDRMHGGMSDHALEEMHDRMSDGYHSETPSSDREDALANWERELKSFEEFISQEREMFKKRLAALPKDKQQAEQEAFDAWLKDRQEEFHRNNPRP